MNLPSEIKGNIESEAVVAKNIRHTMSSGIAFIESAIANLKSKRADLSQAVRVQEMGLEKLYLAMDTLDQLIKLQNSSTHDESGGLDDLPE